MQATALPALAVALLSAAGPKDYGPALRAAIDAYGRQDDARVVEAFQAILGQRPPSAVAAKAHLYLGIIAFNALQPDEARVEFTKAIEANPAIDLPPHSSPKVTLAFAEARRAVSRDLLAEPAPQRPANAAPEAAVTAPGPAAPEVSSDNHILSWTLGGVALVCVAVAVYGGVQVIDFNSTAAHANKELASGQPLTEQSSTLQSEQGPASFWSGGWIAFAAAGAVAAGVGVLTW